MKEVFRRSVLLFCLSLAGINSHAAGASAWASASVVSPIGVNNATTGFWDVLFGKDASVGRVTIRIAGGGAVGYLRDPGDLHLAQSALVEQLQRASGNGVLSGGIAVDLSVSTRGVTGPVIVTVAYN